MSTTESVRSFWQRNPCAAKMASAEPNTTAFFAEIDAAKDKLEPHKSGFADFSRWSDKDVLEVGVGLGSDFARFAAAGARATGVDLTEAAVEGTQERLALDGLAGDVLVADAERLPFADDSFDLVYSWGVIHHSPDPLQALREVRRVLRVGGEARLMLYARWSWFALAVWARQMLRERRPMSVEQAAARGLESPGTQVLSRRRTEELLRTAGFRQVRIRKLATSYDRQVLGPLAPLARDSFGWHLLVQAS